MKTSTPIKKAFVFLICIASFWACKKDDQPNPVNPGKDPEPQPPTEIVTEIGAPQGTPVSVLIGKEGGSISSADGRIKIDIPAGALAGSTNVSIQPVSNKMFNGIGVAYRLTPAGLQLEKSATYTINYTDAEVEGTNPEALRMAYQNTNGAWKFKEDVTVDAAQKKVTGNLKELKDQALFTKYILIPGKASVQINEGVELQVRLVSFRIPTGNDSEILVEGEELANASKVKSWRLNGQAGPTSGANGSLSGALGAKMSYKAPASVPAQNPVAVSVEMDGPSGSKIILISNITVKMFKWVMDVEWLRTSTCTPGAIAAFTYTATTKIEFELDNNGKITNVEVKGEDDGMVSGIESCLPDFYSATGEATGIHITDMVGGIDQNGKLDFDFKGDWMDFPTFTLHYKDGSSSKTEESYQTFEGINTFTKMPLKDGDELNMRNAEPTGFIFRLTTMEK
ncbi:hypothetical protein GXP67_26025 [Rhodocytophaga rosea]|uniref:ZU5 domain-containing protein n=1 Tax=Rhodocytophaga rosea TaxID=2704465 RepID=A0A6C0GPM4_9BACT|nr:hypothetical protein [Rhodocytophaga rosea]QHT69857.1 hypothetical protein GXP67_26025 [Rhodocytophaga rosea]